MDDLEAFAPQPSPIHSLRIQEEVQLLLECGHNRAQALAMVYGRALVRLKARSGLVARLTGLPDRHIKRLYRSIWGGCAKSGQGPSDGAWFLAPQRLVFASRFLAHFNQVASGAEIERFIEAYRATEMDSPKGWTPERAWDLLVKVKHNDLGYGPCTKCGQVSLAESNHVICPECNGKLKRSKQLRNASFRRSIREDLKQFLD